MNRSTSGRRGQWVDRARDLAGRATDAANRARVVVRVGRQTGLVRELSPAGVRELGRALLRGAQSPARIYRIHAINSPHKTAVIYQDRCISFRELDSTISRVAAALTARGFGKGSSMIVCMHNRPEFIMLQSGSTRAGGSAVSAAWRSKPDELVYMLEHSGARFIAADAASVDSVTQAARKVGIDPANVIVVGDDVPAGGTPFDAWIEDASPTATDVAIDEDAAVVVYTSGTTGKPKGAVRKFPKDTLPAALRFIAETPMRADDVHLVACPFYHSTAFGFASLTHLLGGAILILDEFKPQKFLDHIERYRVTTTAVVPTMLHRVLTHVKEHGASGKTRTLRAVFSGGAPLSGALARSFMDEFGDVVYNFYGATETGLVTLGKPADLRSAPGTIGRAIPGNDIRLLDDEGRDVGVGGVGELYVKNKLLVAGYHGDPDATAKSYRDGYFSVGDLARRDAAGRFFIEGRKRDMIISGGVNVYPAEIEELLARHEDIAEVAVVGIPDEEWGERVRAVVVRRPGSDISGEALTVYCKGHLGGAKVPREFVFLESLPRNPTGKVLKRELRQLSV